MRNEYLIGTDECAKRLGSKDVKLVDCRFSLADTEWGRNEYQKSHIPGAVYAHIDEDLSGAVIPGLTGRHPLPESTDFVRQIASWGISNEDQVIVYDQSHGGLAARLWWMLRWMGHDNTCVLDGGWAEWNKVNMPVNSDGHVPEISRFAGEPNQKMVIELSEISEWSNEVSRTIVDARAHIRFTGEKEHIDPVAGHISGACNMPFLENMNENGTWKSPAELRVRYAEIIAGRPEQTAVYCGSGVTACHNILALEVAGFHGAYLYPGSWSEWIASGKNPISQGVK